MKRILLTGMSGTGKSTLIAELKRRGLEAVDLDTPEWSTWASADGEPEWVWREDRVAALLDDVHGDVLFLSGCASNQGKFYPEFDQVILLSTPWLVMKERLATRRTNEFGKSDEELTKIQQDLEAVEPLLRRTCSAEIRTDRPFSEVVERVLKIAGVEVSLPSPLDNHAD